MTKRTQIKHLGQFQEQLLAYHKQVEFSAEEAVLENELNKMENDLMKKVHITCAVKSMTCAAEPQGEASHV